MVEFDREGFIEYVGGLDLEELHALYQEVDAENARVRGIRTGLQKQAGVIRKEMYNGLQDDIQIKKSVEHSMRVKVNLIDKELASRVKQ